MAVSIENKYNGIPIDDLWNLYNQNPEDEYILLALTKSLCYINKKPGERERNLLGKLSRCSDIDVRLEAARIYRTCECYDECYSLLEELLGNGIDSIIYYEFGCLFEHKRDMETAKKWHNRAISEFPTNASYSILALAKILIFEGKDCEAEKLLKSLLTKDNKTHAILELGKIYSDRGDYSDAIQAYISLLFNKNHKSRDYKFALLELGKTFVSCGSNGDAKTCFSELKFVGNKKDANYATVELAKLATLEGNNSEALNLLRKLYGTASSGFAKSESAKIYSSMSNFTEAEKLYMELLQGTRKDKFFAYIGLGKTKLLQGKYDEARMWYGEAKNNTDLDPEFYEICLAEIDFKERKFDCAIERLKKLLNQMVERRHMHILYWVKSTLIYQKLIWQESAM